MGRNIIFFVFFFNILTYNEPQLNRQNRLMRQTWGPLGIMARLPLLAFQCVGSDLAPCGNSASLTCNWQRHLEKIELFKNIIFVQKKKKKTKDLGNKLDSFQSKFVINLFFLFLSNYNFFNLNQLFEANSYSFFSVHFGQDRVEWIKQTVLSGRSSAGDWGPANDSAWTRPPAPPPP